VTPAASETTVAPVAVDSTVAPAVPETTAPAAETATGPGEALPARAPVPDTTSATPAPPDTAPTTPVAADPAANTVPADPAATTLPVPSDPTATTLPPVTDGAAGAPAIGPDGVTPADQDLAEATVVLADENGNRMLLGPTFLLGDGIASAEARVDDATGQWYVQADLTSEGAPAFDAGASQCYSGSAQCPPTGVPSNGGGAGGRIGIVLDHQVVSSPTVNAPSFDGQVQISGEFTEGEAKNLALALRYGSLPVELEPQAVQTVSASLGNDSLRAGVIAGLVGVALVLAFMIFYYRSLGLVVLAGLCVSAALLWTVLAILGETRGLALTLAGATGIIVSIGVTVDSYVVYFERLRDELRAGRTVRVDDTAADPLTAGPIQQAAYAAIGTRAFIDAPLIKTGRLAAILYVLNDSPRAWTNSEVALVEEVAGRTWAAVERACAEAALRESERLLRAIGESSADAV
jgi:preprotein translocase subunit SecD